MLKLKNIVKEYSSGASKVAALKGISVELRKSEFVSVLGPSGCGKTTLLNVIGGLDRYDAGDLIINGKSTKEFKDGDWDAYRNHSVGFVFQNYNLIPHQTALANVELALTLAGVSKKERRRRAKDALERVGLGDLLHKKPNQLSGGQTQRIAVARALVNDPEVLLADEPTGALDSETSVQVMDLLKEISRDRLVVTVTHNSELAEKYSTRIIRLFDGRIADDSNPCVSEGEELKEQTKKEKKAGKKAAKKNLKNPSMSFFTALSLSLTNLMTKKARALLTSFAGSIGIIGIALILSLSSGFQAYIDSIQRETLASYPITLERTSMDVNLADMNSMIGDAAESASGEIKHGLDKVYSNALTASIIESFASEIWSNNLSEFKRFLESDAGGVIKSRASSVQYAYGGKLNIYSSDVDKGINRVYPSPPTSVIRSMTDGVNFGGASIDPSATASLEKYYNSWQELINNEETLNGQYRIVKGNWPKAYDEVVLIIDKNNEISDLTVQGLGFVSAADMLGAFTAVQSGEKYVPKSYEFEYDEIIGKTFKLVLEPDYFKYDEKTKTWTDMRGDEEYVKKLIKNGRELRVVGIVKPSDNSLATAVMGAVGYTSALNDYVVNETNKRELVKLQRADPKTDAFTGIPFKTGEDEKSENKSKQDAPSVSKTKNASTPAGSRLTASSLKLASGAPRAIPVTETSKFPVAGSVPAVSEEEIYEYIDKNYKGEEAKKTKRAVELILKPALSISERKELISYLDEALEGREIEGMGTVTGRQAYSFLQVMDKEGKLKTLSAIIAGGYGPAAPGSGSDGKPNKKPNKKPGKKSDAKPGDDVSPEKPEPEQPEPEPEPKPEPEPFAKSCEEALSILGAADLNDPQSIYIYPVDFESKDYISDAIKKYNEAEKEKGREKNAIKYIDYMGLLLTSATRIIDIVSYVLIAFVAISLVVSSIMIGVITYISVLERTKEIGVLRSLGASKRDISRVFNAETLIIGLVSGVMGILLTSLLIIPTNALIQRATALPNAAKLPTDGAVILIIISAVLTIIAGLIPSRIAARKNPVEALRTE